MRIEALAVGPLQVNCFIVACPVTRQAAVIDPGDEGERILHLLRGEGLELKLVINTHGHFDHVGANRFLVEATGAELCLHSADRALLLRAADHAARYGLRAVDSPEPRRLLADGDRLQVGELTLEVLHTPGHTPGGVCLYTPGHLFSGDTLFAGSVGRTDLPGGDMATLIAGIRNRLWSLPEETQVHPGHGPDTTLGREKTGNPYAGLGTR